MVLNLDFFSLNNISWRFSYTLHIFCVSLGPMRSRCQDSILHESPVRKSGEKYVGELSDNYPSLMRVKETEKQSGMGVS